MLLFIPNMLLLSGRLLTDARVPATERALVAGAIVYAIIPFDLIPDMIPFVGQIDDAYLVALTLLRLMDRTDPKIVREHWSGGGDIVELIGAAALTAAKLLPKPVLRVLTSHVEIARDHGKKISGISKPLLVVRDKPEKLANPASAQGV